MEGWEHLDADWNLRGKFVDADSNLLEGWEHLDADWNLRRKFVDADSNLLGDLDS